MLILHRGLRRGEAVGLREDSVDLDNRRVVIRQQITTVRYRAVTKKVKSDAGDRTIALDETTTSVLKSHDVRRRGWRLQGGPHWNLGHGLFFVQPNGKPWHPELVSERFTKLVDGAGLPPIRLHDLRHCAASYLKAAGADLSASGAPGSRASRQLVWAGPNHPGVARPARSDVCVAAAGRSPSCAEGTAAESCRGTPVRLVSWLCGCCVG